MTQRPVPFLSNALAARRDRLWALGLVIASLATLVGILSYASTPWPLMVAFIPADDTGLTLIYVITGMLFIGQFVQLRRPSLMILSSGYVFAGIIVIFHLLSYAQVLRALRPEAANEQSTAWLFVAWHAFVPLFILAYALTTDTIRDRPVAPETVRRWVAGGVALALGLVALSVWLAVFQTHHLPPLLRSGDYSEMIRSGVSPTMLAITVLALVVLVVRTRIRRALDLWLGFVLFAWTLDLLVGTVVSRTPFLFGWYGARIYSLLAAVAVLASMLTELGQLYGRLDRALTEVALQSTALQESEAALRHAQKMEAIGRLTGGVAHDFNNLLTVIIGALDLLNRRSDPDPVSTRLAGYAMEAAVRGERLTKQLLAFSRREVLNPERVSPDRLIREFSPLMDRAVGTGIQVMLRLDASSADVLVDRSQFESAMLNLAVNARDAMPEGGSIRIETRRIRLERGTTEIEPGSYVEVSVADTGSGMDADTLSRVFEPFFTTKPVGQGSGLGLSQVYGFARAAGGQVLIESQLGAGTTIRIQLPELSQPAVEVKRPASDADRLPEGSGETILVVEDEPAVLVVTANALGNLGYGVRTATDAASALEALSTGPAVDLLFSDIVMPGGINGIELAREARRTNPALRILLTSGFAADAMKGQGPLPEGVDILAKPYRQADLARAIRAALDRPA